MNAFLHHQKRIGLISFLRSPLDVCRACPYFSPLRLVESLVSFFTPLILYTLSGVAGVPLARTQGHERR